MSTPDPADADLPAVRAARELGLDAVLTRHGRVGSLAEAAAARGVEPAAIVKTMVVRLADDDYRFVLVPGDREIAWPRLRALLGVNRVSMPSAQTALEVTGYPRGAITPLGAAHAWPVVADSRLRGPVSIGAGEHGVALTVDAAALLAALGAARRRRHRALRAGLRTPGHGRPHRVSRRHRRQGRGSGRGRRGRPPGKPQRRLRRRPTRNSTTITTTTMMRIVFTRHLLSPARGVRAGSRWYPGACPSCGPRRRSPGLVTARRRRDRVT